MRGFRQRYGRRSAAIVSVLVRRRLPQERQRAVKHGVSSRLNIGKNRVHEDIRIDPFAHPFRAIRKRIFLGAHTGSAASRQSEGKRLASTASAPLPDPAPRTIADQVALFFGTCDATRFAMPGAAQAASQREEARRLIDALEADLCTP